jgi:hypothetical protein
MLRTMLAIVMVVNVAVMVMHFAMPLHSRFALTTANDSGSAREKRPDVGGGAGQPPGT